MSSQPRLGIVGPMLGSHSGWVVSQGEIIAGLFAEEGYTVRQTSTVRNRLLRLVDTMRAILSWRHQVDVLIVMVFSGPAFGIADVASLLAHTMRIPLVLWLHGGNLPDFSERHPRWTRRVLQRSQAIVSPSDYLAQVCEKLGLAVNVIPNVLDLEKYPYQLRRSVRPRLLWMRTFHPIYNPLLALEVVERLRHDYPDVMLTMAGQEKGLLGAVEQQVDEHGLTDCVQFAGFLNLTEKQKRFEEHDIFLNTNHIDNMPVSLLEAGACGLPIVATDVGGVSYLLEDGSTGLLVGEDDPDAMTQAVKRLLHQPETAERLSRGGRLLAEQSDW
ncbi:MAG: glycosyltransferase family 4 protein, partial [Anaerolineaceae bacterium]